MPYKPKELALELIADPAQRQLIEALADTQTLPDDHPTWIMIAMVAVVTNGTRSELDATATELARLKSEIAELKNQGDKSAAASAELSGLLSDIRTILADAAHLNRRMPSFLDKLEEVFAYTQARIESIDAKIGRQ